VRAAWKRVIFKGGSTFKICDHLVTNFESWLEKIEKFSIFTKRLELPFNKKWEDPHVTLTGKLKHERDESHVPTPRRKPGHSDRSFCLERRALARSGTLFRRVARRARARTHPPTLPARANTRATHPETGSKNSLVFFSSCNLEWG
jgi:hypothetical protein